MKHDNLSRTETVGEYIAEFLAEIGIDVVFGVISIHNMPILDAIARQGRIRFVPARGEAGAMNMADAWARVSGRMGVVITSTGTAAGNAAGAQVEALTAGTPLLHITSQVDTPFMDRDRAPIHDVPKQPEMLRGVSKTVVRMWDAKGAPGALTAAVTAAISAPTGPVSLEVPVDIQRQPMPVRPTIIVPVPQNPRATEAGVAALAERIAAARRPIIWFGGGARGAAAEAAELVRRGCAAVTSTNGRAVVSEDEKASLGAFNMTPEAQEIFDSCDLMVVVGSRLRGNETLNNTMRLPRLVQIDAEPSQGGRNYPVELFIHGDAADTLARVLARLPGKLDTDPDLPFDIASARARAEGVMRSKMGPYQLVADALVERVAPGRHPWVRDVTISNSTFGNRYVKIGDARHGVHALGGGIGQGVAMGIGAALASPDAKAITLLGDGGTMLGLSEMITAVEEQAPLVYVLMNDQAYGVIRNIQDAQYGSRHHYSVLKTPDFRTFCASIDMPHEVVSDVGQFAEVLDRAIAAKGPRLVEVDMCAIGPFAENFSGPPAGAAGNKV